MDGSTPLSYAHGIGAAPLLGETIGENLRRTVANHPDREALVVCHQGVRLSYRQLWDEAGLVARGLLALGVGPGDRVGIWASNRYEWVVVQYATARLGAVLVNVNPAYLAHEIEYVLQQSGARVLLHADGFRANRYGPMLDAVCGKCPELKSVLHLDREWGELKRNAAGVSEGELSAIESTLQFDDPINIQYTSGTTGNPKAATLTHHNILNNGYFVALQLGYTPDDRVTVAVPFYHCFGMVLANLACTS